MEPVGFAVGVIPELRQQIQSIMTRIEKFRTGPEAFQALKTELDNMGKLIAEIEGAQKLNPKALPEVSSPWFSSRLKAVQGCLQEAEPIMQQLCSVAFRAGSSEEPKRKKIKARVQRLTRAKANAKEMAAVEEKVTKASRVLDLLTSELSLSIRVGDMGTKCTSASAEPTYTPEGSSPALPHTVSLNFDLLDADGKPAAPEAFLKYYVLSEAAEVIAAAGVLNPAYGVVGMAGVGKTVALQGLAFDDDIQKHFSDGIHYMSLGKGATLQTVVGEIASIMRVTGAKQIADSVEKSSSVREAVHKADMWFRGRTSLFLVDDLWPTSEKTGYLHDLRQLLKRSPASRMVITTRSIAIAQSAGSIVDFDARDPTGPVSERIFMSYARPCGVAGTSRQLEATVKSSVFKILVLCGGLPIALSVAGCSVATLARRHGTFESACIEYGAQLRNTKNSLREEPGFGGSTLNAGILLSLQCLEAEYENWKEDYEVDTKYTVNDLYVSLCVLQNQGWIPLSVLSRLWKLDDTEALKVAGLFCGMSLATLQRGKHKSDGEGGGGMESGLMLHDLHLDFCQHQARRSKKIAYWHSELLSGYLKDEKLLGFKTRQWWCESVPSDGYIYNNLARHLVHADRRVELGALLLDARWTHLRMSVGGITALQGDFESFGCFAGTMAKGRKGCTFSKDVYESFALLFKTLQVSWGRISEGWRELQFQMCGRLVNLRKSNVVLNKYVKSLLKHTEKPYLVPVTPFFPDPRSGEVMDIPVGDSCDAICCSPCGRYIVVRTRNDALVLDALSGATLHQAILPRRLGDASRCNQSVAISPDSKRIAVACNDDTIRLWAWESCKSSMEILKGHEAAVRCVAISSDGERLFSGSDDRTLRIWDITTGVEIGVYRQTFPVGCLALSADSQKIALCLVRTSQGLAGGTLRILDSCTGALLFEHEEFVGFESIAFCPNDLYFVTGSSQNIQLWCTLTWALISKTDRKSGVSGVKSVSFSSDGKQIVAGSDSGSLWLWRVESGATVRTVCSLRSSVNCVAFNGDGKRVISGSEDGRVRVWDLHLSKQYTEAPDELSRDVRHVSISRDGLRVASTSGYRPVRIWDSQTGAQVGKLEEKYNKCVRCVSFSPDGRRLVCGQGNGVLRLWDLETFTVIVGTMEGHYDSVSCVAFSYDGLRIVSGSHDGKIRVWNAVSLKPIGNPLAGFPQEGHNRIRRFAEIANPLEELPYEGNSRVRHVAESIGGGYIVACNVADDNRVYIRNQSTGMILKTFWKRARIENGSSDKNLKRIENETEIDDDEAVRIIRSCSYETSLLWPSSVRNDDNVVYVRGNQMYSNTRGQTILLGSILGEETICNWNYHAKGNVFAAALQVAPGGVAICTAVFD